MKESLKSLSFNTILFLIGAAFILIGLTGGFSITNYTLTIQENWARITAATIGMVLVIVAIYAEIKSKSRESKPVSGKDETKNTGKETPAATSKPEARVSAEDFFYTVDDKFADSFPNLVQDAKRLSILGRTAVNLLSQYHKTFETLGKAGCEIRLLFVDPQSETSKLLYGSNLEIYRSNITTACSHLKALKQTLGHQLAVRVMNHAPTISIIVIEKQDFQQSFLQAQFYFLHSAVGCDRPVFIVQAGDKWYDIFREEFSMLWSNSQKWGDE